VFQSYALYPHMTVRRNIMFPLKFKKVPEDEARRRAEEAARLVRVEELLERQPSQMSGGQQQRVALARALVKEPQLLLLDEPLSNLDAKLRALARDELKQFQADVGTTTIYVTHDQAEAMGLGDRIAVMYEGRLRQIGPPREVYEDPADTFVATFLGSPPMNLVPRDGHLVGFRPENLLPAEVVSDGNSLTARLHIARIEYLSGDRHVYGTLHGIGEETRVIARLPATVTLPLEDGDEREFAIHERDLRFFDADTGEQTAPQPVRA
jgi:multiple sugar transport system ATP-binding protein